ncbi:MAG: PIN domain-containing protein [Microbacteriaceae bacterium]|nr:PIN domain-containing protein [Microbacteriaceae bacterium]
MAVAQAVLVDTDVFSALYVTPRENALRQGHPVDEWTEALTGRRPLISFQTRAEILSGALLNGWGERRLATVQEILDAAPTIDEDVEVIAAYARLLAEAQKAGHPLGDKRNHVGDRWIAACAIAKDLPLLTGNRRHFENAPRLALLD